MSVLKKFVLLFAVVNILLSLAEAGAQERKLKPGDVIEIAVSEHEELSRSVVVSPQGKVDYPFIEDVPVDGITVSRLREILVAQLTRAMEARPFVMVRLTDSYPITVTVQGSIARPGAYTIRNTTTLQSAIAEAGGFVPGAQLSQIKLSRKDGSVLNQQTVNLETFYRKGDLGFLPALKDGDTIIVPGNPAAATVKVLGYVAAPGSYEVAFQTSLIDVLALAGGPTDEADLSHVKLLSLSGQSGREVKINFNELLQSSNTKNIPTVAPGDVVYVPKARKTLKGVVTTLRDLSAFVTLYLLIRSETR